MVLADDGSPGVSEVKLYVDGLQDAISLVGPGPVNTAVGTEVLIGTNWANYFEGVMDEVRIYDRALSSAEVAGLAAMD